MIITIQAIREAGSRCGRKITRAITATWTRKSRSAPSVEKNEYSVMPSLVLYQSPAPMTLVHSLLRRLASPRPPSACSCSAGPVQTPADPGVAPNSRALPRSPSGHQEGIRRRLEQFVRQSKPLRGLAALLKDADLEQRSSRQERVHFAMVCGR